MDDIGLAGQPEVELLVRDRALAPRPRVIRERVGLVSDAPDDQSQRLVRPAGRGVDRLGNLGRRKVNNLLALAVLSYLARRPMHPYEVGRTLRENGDARSIKFNHGSLYMVFEQLTRAGFVAAQQTTREGLRPERTLYTLTTAGRQEARDWLRELVEEPQHEYPHFVAALSLIGALHPDEAVELLRRRLGRLAEQRKEIVRVADAATAAGVHPLFLVEEDYRLALVDAEVTFVERFVERITDPNEGWSRLWAQLHDQSPGSDHKENE